jgi:hypothetical protein
MLDEQRQKGLDIEPLVSDGANGHGEASKMAEW